MNALKNKNRVRPTHRSRTFKRAKHPDCEIDENGYYLYPCELCGKPVKVDPKWYQNMYKDVISISHINIITGTECPT